MKMRWKNPQLVQKWSSRAASAAGDWNANIQGLDPSNDPMKKAADKADYWLLRVQESKDKFKAGVAGTTMADWQTACRVAGVTAYRNGVTNKTRKYTRYQANLQTLMPQLQSLLATLPANTEGERDTRSSKTIQWLRDQGKAGKFKKAVGAP